MTKQEFRERCTTMTTRKNELFIEEIRKEADQLAILIRHGHDSKILTVEQVNELARRINVALNDLYQKETPLDVFWKFLDDIQIDRGLFKPKLE